MPELVKVRLVKKSASGKPGDVLEVDAARAEAWLKAGIAEDPAAKKKSTGGK